MWVWPPLLQAAVAEAVTGTLATTLDAATLGGTGTVTAPARTATLATTLDACTFAGTVAVRAQAQLLTAIPTAITDGTSGQAGPEAFNPPTGTFTFDIGTPTNGMLCVAVFARQSGVVEAAPSMTWNGVAMSTYTTNVAYGASSTMRGTLGWLPNPAPGSHDLVITRVDPTGQITFLLLWMTVNHTQTSGIADERYAAGNASAGDPSIGPITPREAGELVVGIAITESDTPLTIGGWGTEVQQLDAGVYNVSLGRVIQTTPAAVTATWSGTDAVWAGLIISFKAGALDGMTLAGTAVVPATAVLATALDACTLAGTGTVTTAGTSGSLAATLGAVTVIGTAVSPIHASLGTHQTSQIAIGASGSSSQAWSGAAQTYSLTIGTPVHGLLVVGFASRRLGFPGVTGLTWNGVAMDLVRRQDAATVGYEAVLAWLVDPAPGTHDLVVSSTLDLTGPAPLLTWFTADHLMPAQAYVAAHKTPAGSGLVQSDPIFPVHPGEGLIAAVYVSEADDPLTINTLWGTLTATSVQALDAGLWTSALGAAIGSDPLGGTAGWTGTDEYWAGVLVFFRPDAHTTLGTLTLSGTAQVAIKATTTATLAACTLAGTGAVTTGAVSGTLAVTLAAATLAGTATVPLHGTTSTTLAACTLAGTGTVVAGNTASLTVTLDALGLSATAVLPDTATFAYTLDACTLTATGIVTIGAPQPVRLTPHATATLVSPTPRAVAALPRTRDAALVGADRRGDPI